MSTSQRERLRDKAGDGSTDYFVEVRQSDLAALLDRIDELLDERKLGAQPHLCLNDECGTISYGSGYKCCPRCGGTDGRDDPCQQAGHHVCGPVDSDLILGRCP